jgi:hypothetical protein
MAHPIELKPFIQVLYSVVGAYFFIFFEKYCTVDFWQTLQKTSIQKHMHFLGCSRYLGLFLRTEGDKKKPKKVGTLNSV